LKKECEKGESRADDEEGGEGHISCQGAYEREGADEEVIDKGNGSEGARDKLPNVFRKPHFLDAEGKDGEEKNKGREGRRLNEKEHHPGGEKGGGRKKNDGYDFL
jgi:hypothetical protein